MSHGGAVAVEVVLVSLAVGLLWLSSLSSYLLFHSIIETAFIAVAVGVFVMAWNLRAITPNGYAVVIGTGLVFAAALGLLHLLAYKGMGVFPSGSADLPTQLWIAARYLVAGTFVAAPFFFARSPRVWLAAAVYAAITALLVASIFWWKVFPVCYVEATGLTAFKKTSEYVIALLFLTAGGLVLWRGRELSGPSRSMLFIAMLTSAAAEMSFTLYVGVYTFPNLLGHLLMFVSVYLIYRGVVTSGMARTYRDVVEALGRRQAELEALSRDLELRVDVRTAELRRAVTELETISYSISHELRSPLRAIDGFSLLALEEGRQVLSPQAVQGLERARRAAQQMGHLIDDLLDVLKLHAWELQPEPVDVSALCAELAAETDTDRLVRFSIEPDMGAMADPALLRVALCNLIDNAVKFSSRETPPEVDVWTEHDRGTTQFFVRDNGVGFDPEEADALFEPFQRLVRQDEFEGTGVGLAIVRRIVHLHGGHVGLVGTPHAGATAWFTLAPDAGSDPEG
jgi:signal transduction histidine kinase